MTNQHTFESVVQWLRSRVSSRSGLELEAIDPDEEVSSYGLTSMEAISLTAELEEYLGIRIDPTLVWEHPSINGLVSHLHEDDHAKRQSIDRRPSSTSGVIGTP
jgi:polyketide synthase 13